MTRRTDIFGKTGFLSQCKHTKLERVIKNIAAPYTDPSKIKSFRLESQGPANKKPFVGSGVKPLVYLLLIRRYLPLN